MHKFTSSLLAALLCGTSLTSGSTWAQERPPITRIAMPDASLRSAFESAARGQLSDAQRALHASHPLTGWLEYAALRSGMDALPVELGTAFLVRNRDQAVAGVFRNEWLAALARREDWPAFLAAWEGGVDSPALRCSQLTARQALGRVDSQWTRDAQALWRSSGKSLPDTCDAPFAHLAAQGELTPALRWERIGLAADDAQAGVIRTIARSLPAGDAALANQYAAFIDAPGDGALQWPKNETSRRVVVAGLAKLAKASPERAESMLPAFSQAFGFDDATRGRVLYEIALWTVASYGPESARRLAAVPAYAYDDKLHEWRAREALARSDWRGALAAIQRMPEPLRNDSRWLYFGARTSELTGNAAAAQALYRQAAQKAEFHGFLAADRLQQPYALCPWTPAVPTTAKTGIARDPALVRALQLFALDRKGWAQREWDDALTRFSDEQRRIAVEVAQDTGWFDRGVFGLVNVGGKRYPEETRLYHLRFPLHHDAAIRREAARNRLDPAWIAAEIRAESVFDPNARSSADARGLMQVLPGTGAEVARKLGVPWAGGESLYDADTNIVLGTAYLRQLMDKYGGKPYLVMAGYNAGPAPLNRWMTQRPAMDADVWIETISYKETRDYVGRVLSFSTVYDWRLNGDATRISDRMLGRSDGQRKRFTCATTASSMPAVAPVAPTRPSLKERRRR